MTEHLVQDPGQTGDSPPGLEITAGPVSNDSSLTPAKSSSTLSSKLRRHGVKVVSALKSLTNSSSEQPTVPEPTSTAPEAQKSKSVFALGIHKMSNVVFRPPLEPTVVRRASAKGRPLLKQTFQDVDAVPISSASASSPGYAAGSHTNSSKTSTSNSNSPTTALNSPAKSSLDSLFRNKDPNTVARNRGRYPDLSPRRARRTPGIDASGTPPSSPKTNLESIQELSPGRFAPGIATVERAAAAKIYLETYFNQHLASGPSPRQMRQQILETDLFNRARERGVPLSAAETQGVRARFCRRESAYLRESRVMKAKQLAMFGGGGGSRRRAERCPVSEYETIKVLGKGSFGVVRLVRDSRKRQVYAMKVIRKGKMLKTSQEGHLRAERDMLVASEGSRWIVPLVASFQDVSNLYLVMEYMPGGDFLSLLIRENVLHESVARFYVAEIILCVEAAHSLKCIHRDIKPDNFLVSASGHLKISDFGLAFDGHWSHDTTYYNSHRDESRCSDAKKRSNGMTTGMEKHDKKDMDDGEPLLNWRNRYGTRKAARSIVGTSQYMAPECIYGHTPFLSEEGRHQTKENILRHHETFGFPPRPSVSRRCQHLMLSLITDREYRLCSERYRMKDLVTSSSSSSSSKAGSRMRDFAGRYVFPYDAEDIKAHKWFRNMPWERLHELEPPIVPRLRSVDDTQYFDDGGSVSDDVSESEAEDEGHAVADANDGAAERVPELVFPSPSSLLPTTSWAPLASYPPQSQDPRGGYFPDYTATSPCTTTSNPNPYSTTPLALTLPSFESPITPHTHPHHPPILFPPSPLTNSNPSPNSAKFNNTPHPHPPGPLSQEQLAFLRPLRYPLQTLGVTALATPAARRGRQAAHA
ncbi:hypothetical protein NEMBOFW57_003422 [Staphylotrichum longicolle]|uniref:non-specific serine/threonine protein kinase n=1 Tax=Staphylotrichum longicolle TaxID=669026 RepID=A0AAD4HZI9_9PEZI|nr:hypothetical protein NEMBOFW57_003422 [Staphylotrichum longicolle]